MDHIPLPQNPRHLPLNAVLWTDEGYDHSPDFFGYPERQGWGPRTTREWERLWDNPCRSFRAFLQRWLYFGVLEKVSGHDLDFTDFATSLERPGDQCLYLSTSSLRHLEISAPDIDFMVDVREIHIFLQMSPEHKPRTDPEQLARVESLQVFIRESNLRDPRCGEMVLATSLLYEYLLCHCWPLRYDQQTSSVERAFNSPTTISSELGQFGYAWGILRNLGWCPHEIMKLNELCNTTGVFYLAHILRPNPRQQHYRLRVSLKHSLDLGFRAKDAICTFEECKYLKLDDEKYTTKHHGSCNRCAFVAVDPQQLSAILKSGTFPVVIVDYDANNNLIARLIPWQPGLSYVAISHVWSDGMGNVHNNALPRCQLERLRTLVQGIEPQDHVAKSVVPFWLDTLCVPPDSVNHPDLQALAIDRMKDVYGGVVLVLDGWLSTTSIETMSVVEILMRIYACTWNSRLWTYQEAGLAEQLWFSFHDGNRDLDEMTQLLLNISVHDPEFVLVDLLLRHFESLRGFRRLRNEPLVKRLELAFFGLLLRSTSVATDEPICIANLLQLDASKIVRTEPSRRMDELWKLIPQVPEAVIDITGRTLESQGLRWAPASFLLPNQRIAGLTGQVVGGIRPGLQNELTRDAEGLHLRKAGTIIHSGDFPIGELFYVTDGDGRWSRMWWTKKDEKAWEQMPKNERGERLCAQPQKVYNTSHIAWIDMEGDLLPNDTENLSNLSTGGPLIAVEKTDNETIYGTKMGYIWRTALNRTHNADEVLKLEGRLGEKLRADRDPLADPEIGDSGQSSILYAALETPIFYQEQKWCLY